jgi:hypothetical protein
MFLIHPRSVWTTGAAETMTLKCYACLPSRAEKLWLVCGVMGDVMLCDRERDIHRSQKCYATIHSEKMTNFTIFLFCKRQFPAAVCFRYEQ